MNWFRQSKCVFVWKKNTETLGILCTSLIWFTQSTEWMTDKKKVLSWFRFSYNNWNIFFGFLLSTQIFLRRNIWKCFSRNHTSFIRLGQSMFWALDLRVLNMIKQKKCNKIFLKNQNKIIFFLLCCTPRCLNHELWIHPWTFLVF